MRRIITEKDLAIQSQKQETVTTLGRTHVEHKQEPILQVPDDYLTKVVKFVPAEIIAVYVAIDGLLKQASNPPEFARWAVFLALLAMTGLYTWRFTRVKNLSPAYTQIAVSTTSFAVWVFALGGPFVFLSWYTPLYGSILLMLFTLIPPLVLGK